MEIEIDDCLTPQHRTLRLIARAAAVLAYVALAFFAIQATANLTGNLYIIREELLDPLPGQQGSALRYLNLGLAFLARLLDGVIFWVLLTGLSLGLRMVAQTDVNYRLRAGEVDDA